jgi:formate hydrogenlyase subunit 3/multisubunit Na+/H+ antiporter MnhD subunit
MAGNLGLLVAADVFSFYTLFALMSFASYILVIHGRGEAEKSAARIYLGFVVVGELALFAGLTLAAATAGSTFLPDIRAAELSGLSVALLLAGFAVKLGIAPLHLWLPLAHTAAPVPASAVLSGAMIKAGLFGLIAVLPLGLVAYPVHGATMIGAGTASILLAALIGVTQANPKAVLAYSSVGQMGLVAVALGAALVAPQAWATALPALVLLAAHHALAKGALFLGAGAAAGPGGAVARASLLFALFLPAAALAAAPFTGGAVAKEGLKAVFHLHEAAWLLAPILTLSSVATTVLMVRFLVLMSRRRAGAFRSWPLVPWLALTALAIAVPLNWQPAPGWDVADAGTPADAALPVLAGVAVMLGGALLLRLAGLALRPVPPGEVLALFVPTGPRPMRAPSLPRAELGWLRRGAAVLPTAAPSWQAGATAVLIVMLAFAAVELATGGAPALDLDVVP